MSDPYLEGIKRKGELDAKLREIMTPEHLGDGAYVRYDGAQAVVVYTMYLDAHAMKSLDRWHENVKKLIDEYKELRDK